MDDIIMSGVAEPDWEHVRPLLDDVFDTLGETDRLVVLMRYFEERSLEEIARTIRTTEDTARKRLNRALDKMNGALKRHGVADALNARISRSLREILTVIRLKYARGPRGFDVHVRQESRQEIL